MNKKKRNILLILICFILMAMPGCGSNKVDDATDARTAMPAVTNMAGSKTSAEVCDDLATAGLSNVVTFSDWVLDFAGSAGDDAGLSDKWMQPGANTPDLAACANGWEKHHDYSDADCRMTAMLLLDGLITAEKTDSDYTVINDRATLTDMAQALFGPGKENLLDRSGPIDPADIGGMYVLTTESGTLGASALYYPDVKEKAAEVIGCSYYVLPSSTHEVILVPDAAGIDEKELCSMVKQANRTVVEPKDVLSDNVNHFDKDTRELSKVSDDRERDSIVAEAR